MATFGRRKKPDGRPHGWYRDCLRLDFEFRCAYCLIHEADYQGHESFEVDHFVPKSKARTLERRYPNLYYACRLCNKRGRKGDHWPTTDEEARGERFVDPCKENWEDHVSFEEDGSVGALTRAGDYSIRTIGLDRDQLRRHRARFPGEYWHRALLRQIRVRIAAVRRKAGERSAELRTEVTALEKEYRTLERMVRNAWLKKIAPPPPPRCPY